jgi:excisionase family DNA binding protein
MNGVTTRQAARTLGVHENTIRNWIKQGIIKAGIGRGRIDHASIDKALDQMFGVTVKCSNCGHITTRTEARTRVFNTGRCGECDGQLNPAVIEVTA